ncbi:MAG: hypothetical protein ACK505_08935 [Flavobacteriales bacterium]|jgi:hypothetical protein
MDNGSSSSSSRLMLLAATALLILFNIVYWTGKFFPDLWPALTALRSSLLAHWGLFMFLEFLAVASLFIDVVVKWDDYPRAQRNMRLFIAGLVCAGFITRFGLGVMDMYLVGEVQ